MKRLLFAGLATLAVGSAPVAGADDIDCFTQDTYGGGTRTTCYTGFPDYDRIITNCDGTGRCTIRGMN